MPFYLPQLFRTRYRCDLQILTAPRATKKKKRLSVLLMPLPPLLRDGINHRSILKSVRSQIHSGKRARQLGITVATRSVCERHRSFIRAHLSPVNFSLSRIWFFESRYCELLEAEKWTRLFFQRVIGASDMRYNDNFVQTENLNLWCDNLWIILPLTLIEQMNQ